MMSPPSILMLSKRWMRHTTHGGLRRCHDLKTKPPRNRRSIPTTNFTGSSTAVLVRTTRRQERSPRTGEPVGGFRIKIEPLGKGMAAADVDGDGKVDQLFQLKKVRQAVSGRAFPGRH